jgi:hypothetical protein
MYFMLIIKYINHTAPNKDDVIIHMTSQYYCEQSIKSSDAIFRSR